MRRSPLDIGMVGRAVGFVAIAAAIVATAVHCRHDDITSSASGDATMSVSSDPLSLEPAPCQAIGMAAKDDAACEAAWAENRRRFLTYRPSPDHPSTAPSINPHNPMPKPEGK